MRPPVCQYGSCCLIRCSLRPCAPMSAQGSEGDGMIPCRRRAHVSGFFAIERCAEPVRWEGTSRQVRRARSRASRASNTPPLPRLPRLRLRPRPRPPRASVPAARLATTSKSLPHSGHETISPSSTSSSSMSRSLSHSGQITIIASVVFGAPTATSRRVHLYLESLGGSVK